LDELTERTDMNEPVFQDASHALHVSYLIHSLPPATVSPTAIVIDQLVKENHVWDEVKPMQAKRVNFGGLSPLEVRGQAAQVVSMVNHLPHEAERFACQAIYGHQVIKADGVRGLGQYCAPVLSCQSKEFALYCAWHVFATGRQRDGMTQGEIAKHFGVTVESVREACAVVRKYGKAMHTRALDVLGERFSAGGLIVDAVYA
jgi:hypothetical protein